MLNRLANYLFGLLLEHLLRSILSLSEYFEGSNASAGIHENPPLQLVSLVGDWGCLTRKQSLAEHNKLSSKANPDAGVLLELLERQRGELSNLQRLQLIQIGIDHMLTSLVIVLVVIIDHPPNSFVLRKNLRLEQYAVRHLVSIVVVAV